MSERGSFVTEFVYCNKCFKVLCDILLGNEKYLMSIKIPHWNNENIEKKTLPIIAGKIGGLYPGEELDRFEVYFVPEIESLICHTVRIAVLAESGEKIFKIKPIKAALGGL